MNIRDINPELRKAAAAAAGYTVVYSGLVSGWGYRWSEEDGRNACWGWNTEEQAWGEAFLHLCETQVVYRHKKGGIYLYLMEGWSTLDGGAPVVVYRHLAPHAVEVWVRPMAEFEEEGRFVRIHV